MLRVLRVLILLALTGIVPAIAGEFTDTQKQELGAFIHDYLMKNPEVLREAALKYAANLVVIGQGSLHKLMGRLRTSAYAIIREAPCPVVRV